MCCFVHRNFPQNTSPSYAADLGLVLVCPDTSPRDCSLPGDSDAYDFGTGAGFYVDACVAPWSQHYRMHSYVTGELLELVTAELPVRAGWQSISGHSMGGHGALICALRNPGTYRSASAFAPISNPCASPWGRKALTGYLGAAGEHKGDGDDDGNDASAWHRWDATELIRRLGKGRPDGLAAANRLRLLVDQGGSDSFLAQRQLLPENLRTACDEAGVQLEYAEHEGYDHGYYFVASFIGKHLAHHHRALTQDEE